MADANPTAPNPSAETPEERLGRAIEAHMAACDADDRLDLLESHLCRMAGAARALGALADAFDGESDARELARLNAALEYIAGSLSRDINSAVNVCDRMQPVEQLRRRWASEAA